jgi:hypothetical protein
MTSSHFMNNHRLHPPSSKHGTSPNTSNTATVTGLAASSHTGTVSKGTARNRTYIQLSQRKKYNFEMILPQKVSGAYKFTVPYHIHT